MTQEVPTIPIGEIEIGPRFRVDYGEIDQLAHSIKKNGLISPLAVGVADKMNIPRETNLPYMLLAGGRRLRALKKLGWTNIPVRIYDQSLTELDFRSIELAENFDRKEMSYVEEIALKREINNLQIQIHGRKLARSANSSGWSQADTARLIKETPANLARDLKLAEAIEKFPELQLDQCKTKADAFKRLNSVGKTLNNTSKAAEYTKTVGDSNALFKRLSASYIVGNCFDTFAKIPSNSLNFIEIDPPYAIDLATVKKDNECLGYNEVAKDDYLEFMSKVISESYRTLRENSWMVCWFAADPWFKEIADLLREHEFKMNMIPCIWTKPSGQTKQPEIYLGNAYEMFFYARKGAAKLQQPGRSNIFNFSPVPPSQKYHPTQRPIELMIELYSTFCGPGSNGYIPFLGSGVGLLAGHANQMNLIGTDLTSEFKDGYILQLKDLIGDK